MPYEPGEEKTYSLGAHCWGFLNIQQQRRGLEVSQVWSTSAETPEKNGVDQDEGLQ